MSRRARLRRWRLLSWEEWLTAAWVVLGPYWLGFWTLLTAPLVLAVVLRGSGRRLKEEDARRKHGLRAHSPHRAVNLLPEESREAGMPPERGSWVLSASTDTKEPGTRLPVMVTTADSSSCSVRGVPWVVYGYQIWYRPVNSSSAPTWSGSGTAAPGVSGAPRGPAT